jgi:hypothetical protein
MPPSRAVTLLEFLEREHPAGVTVTGIAELREEVLRLRNNRQRHYADDIELRLYRLVVRRLNDMHVSEHSSEHDSAQASGTSIASSTTRAFVSELAGLL